MQFPRRLFAPLLLLPALHGTAHPGAETSIARLGQLIAAHPMQQTLYIQRGGLLAHHGQWQRALDDLALARTLGDPRAAGFELGRLYYHRGEQAQARAAFSAFLSLHPGHPDALLYRARAAQADGDTQAALADYNSHFRQVEKPHPGDLLAAARLLAASGQNGIAPAITLLDQGVARIGPQPQLQRYAIELALSTGNLPAALRRCRELRAILGPGPQWQLEMARLLLLAGRENQARSLLDQAQAQLNELRSTPARRALRDEIEQLRNASLAG